MRNKKKKLVIASTLLAVGTAGAAYAYWSTQGEGTGSATTAQGAANLSLAQTSTISGMYPGDSAQTIAGTVTNNAENSAYVTKVVASISGVTKASGVQGTCDASDYTLAGANMNVGQDIASGATVSFSGATIKFNNKATNQDACKGATVSLAFAAS